MKKFAMAAAAATMFALAACGGNADDRAAENVVENADNVADNFEAMAENATNDTAEDALEQRADDTREKAEEKAEAIDDNDNSAAEQGGGTDGQVESNVAGM
jgi:protein involved in sex pheromone biosynthesis